jgi:hypothetical protein
MAVSKRFDVITPGDEYTPRGETQAKTFWHNVGVVTVMDDGKMFLRLSMLPKQTFMLSLQESKEERAAKYAQNNTAAQTSAPVIEGGDQGMSIDDIPGL